MQFLDEISLKADTDNAVVYSRMQYSVCEMIFKCWTRTIASTKYLPPPILGSCTQTPLGASQPPSPDIGRPSCLLSILNGCRLRKLDKVSVRRSKQRFTRSHKS